MRTNRNRSFLDSILFNVSVLVIAVMTITIVPAADRTRCGGIEKPPKKKQLQRDPAAKRSAILEDPYDFSQPPTLPEIDPISEGQIYSALDRGVRFLIEDQKPQWNRGGRPHVPRV